MEETAGRGVEHPLTQAKLRQVLLVARFDLAMLLLVSRSPDLQPIESPERPGRRRARTSCPRRC